MKSKIKVLFFLAVLLASQTVISQNNIIDEIVWVVGDEAILKSEVEEYRKEMLMQNQRIEGDPYCFIPGSFYHLSRIQRYSCFGL